MFATVDPVPMVQLINILGDDYVVWDKSAEILFKRPAREHLYAEFAFSEEDIADIKKRVSEENEIDYHMTTPLTNRDASTTRRHLSSRRHPHSL